MLYKRPWGKERQVEYTITHNIGIGYSVNRKLAEGRKKLSKKQQGQPVLTG